MEKSRKKLFKDLKKSDFINLAEVSKNNSVTYKLVAVEGSTVSNGHLKLSFRETGNDITLKHIYIPVNKISGDICMLKLKGMRVWLFLNERKLNRFRLKTVDEMKRAYNDLVFKMGVIDGVNEIKKHINKTAEPKIVTTGYVETRPMTTEERVGMYSKLSKEELVNLVIQKEDLLIKEIEENFNMYQGINQYPESPWTPPYLPGRDVWYTTSTNSITDTSIKK